jgi:hypothetical protein
MKEQMANVKCSLMVWRLSMLWTSVALRQCQLVPITHGRQLSSNPTNRYHRLGSTTVIGCETAARGGTYFHLMPKNSHIVVQYRLQELSHLTNSFTQLKQAQAKFKSCVDNVGEIKPQNKGMISVYSERGQCSTCRSLRENNIGSFDQLLVCSRQAIRPRECNRRCGHRVLCQKGVYRDSYTSTSTS